MIITTAAPIHTELNTFISSSFVELKVYHMNLSSSREGRLARSLKIAAIANILQSYMLYSILRSNTYNNIVKENMPEDTDNIISLETFEFIFRHPWLIVCSVVAIMNIAHAFVYAKPLSYQCNAVLSFELAGEATMDRKSADPRKELIDARRDLLSKVLLGENIHNIIEAIEPGISEKTTPAKYNSLVGKFRDPKSGIQIRQDDKTNINIVEISFVNTDPDLCYRAVKATAEAVKAENIRASAGKVQSKIDFLNKQVDFYKNRITGIDRESENIRSFLIDNFALLTEREKDLIAGVTGESETVKQQKLMSFAKYDETLAQLNLDLIELERKKENLNKQLSGDVSAIRRRADEAQSDIFLEEYSKAIAAKELEAASLISSGYKPEHPQIKKIQSEIEKLKELGRVRRKELSGSSESIGADTIKEKISSDIEDLDYQIESLKTKIKAIGEYRRGAVEQFRPKDIGRKDIADKAARLVELEREKEINEGYYLDIRKQLEEAELKGRVEKEEAGLKIVTVEEPRMPSSPMPLQRIKPLLAGLIVAVGAGLSLAYVVDSLNSSLRTGKELRRLIMIPVLATLDKITSAEEMAGLRLRRKVIIIGLIAFVIASRIAIKILW